MLERGRAAAPVPYRGRVALRELGQAADSFGDCCERLNRFLGGFLSEIVA
jgi:hypothetical protein